MNSIKDIINMVATEAVEGTWGNSGIGDEAPPVHPFYENNPPADTSLEPYDVGLVRDPKTGNIRWSK